MKLFNDEAEVNAELGITPILNPDLSWVQPKNQKAIVAVNTLFNVHEAHNKANGFVPNWADSSQRKHNVLQWIEENTDKASGFGFSGTYYVSWHTTTAVGSRLVVGTIEECIHIGTKYMYLYEDWFL